MRQRVMIAMAMALDPALLIADEPTTALDVTVQAQVLEVMQQLQDQFGTAIILITHDLGVVAEMADQVVVMYAGRAMESAPRRTLFYHPHHPYAEGLLRVAALAWRPHEAAHPDPWDTAVAHRPAARVPLRPALPPRVRRLQPGPAAAQRLRATPTTCRRAGCPTRSSGRAQRRPRLTAGDP